MTALMSGFGVLSKEISKTQALVKQAETAQKN